MERLGAEHRHKLIDTRDIIEARDGEIISELDLATPTALGEALEDVFNAQLPASTEELFARLSQTGG